jgi:hypothetical protein
MRARWMWIAAVAATLFGVNLVARLVTVHGGFSSSAHQLRIGVIAVVCVAVILVGAAAWWSIRYPVGRVVTDLGAAIGLAAVASTVVGPLVAGSKPFAGGLSLFVGQLLLFAGIGAVGVLLGFIGVVALGRDWKSRSLKSYADRYRAKPTRMVRGRG